MTYFKHLPSVSCDPETRPAPDPAAETGKHAQHTGSRCALNTKWRPQQGLERQGRLSKLLNLCTYAVFFDLAEYPLDKFVLTFM